jgi:hypothetical protein
MKKFNVKVDGALNEIPVYVDELTDIMQMKIRENESDFTLFECGVDFRNGLWISTIGVYGYSLQQFIINYFRLVYSKYPDIKYILICDDPIYEDQDNKPVNGDIAYENTMVTEVDTIG